MRTNNNRDRVFFACQAQNDLNFMQIYACFCSFLFLKCSTDVKFGIDSYICTKEAISTTKVLKSPNETLLGSLKGR